MDVFTFFARLINIFKHVNKFRWAELRKSDCAIQAITVTYVTYLFTYPAE